MIIRVAPIPASFERKINQVVILGSLFDMEIGLDEHVEGETSHSLSKLSPRVSLCSIDDETPPNDDPNGSSSGSKAHGSASLAWDEERARNEQKCEIKL